MKLIILIALFPAGLVLQSFLQDDEVVVMYLIGDSTMADYTLYEGDYMQERYPLTGWGQVFQPFVTADSLKKLRHLITADSVLVDDRARGGRSTRTFFQEGRWRKVYESLEKDDIVLMQFGHNDAAEEKHERYVNIEGFQEFLRLFISQTLQKEAIPIVLTPVSRNYPWENGRLGNVHGDYPEAARDVAAEFGIPCIDLTQRSIEAFSGKGKDYVSENYFMNLEPGTYDAYPEGQNDNTHFQPEGARAVCQLVLDGLKEITFDRK